MWYTVLITLVVDFGGLLLLYALLRDRVRRATSAAAQIAEIRDEVSRMVVELNQTTDRNIALIEDRISSLNALLAAADKKLGLLRRETEKHDLGTRVYGRLMNARGTAAELNARGTTAESDASSRSVLRESRGRKESAEYRWSEEERQPGKESAEYRWSGEARPEGIRGAEQADVSGGNPRSTAGAGNPRSTAGAATTASGDPGTARGLVVELAEKSPEKQDLRSRVMALHRAGFSPSLVAARTGIPMGEVELIISLEQRKVQHARAAR